MPDCSAQFDIQEAVKPSFAMAVASRQKLIHYTLTLRCKLPVGIQGSGNMLLCAVVQQAEDAIEMTPQPNGIENEVPLPDGEEIPMPDAMDYHPEEDIAPPTTGRALMNCSTSPAVDLVSTAACLQSRGDVSNFKML